MAWEVEFTDGFGEWWNSLEEEEQDAIDVVVGLLEERGPQLPFPRSSKVASSRHANLRELRIQYRGRPHVPMADALYDEHLEVLRREGLIDGT